jgi:hydroxyacylglutathione hydrolase
MASVVSFTFNPFQENTYVVFDDTNECIIVDPGCYDQAEQARLKNYINNHNLKPVRLINTHCHIDHVFGNRFVADTWNLGLEIHEGEVPVLESCPQVAMFYGVSYPDPSPMPERFIKEGDTITFGQTELKALFTPGHSPASLSFYCAKDQFILAGDVLFYQSIGRTDLPGGDYDTLISSIKEKYFPLGDEVVVYSGHGPETTVGAERRSNPFLV